MKVSTNKVLTIVLLVVCLFLSACKKNQPQGIIKPSNMENVLYDYHIAQAMIDNLPLEDTYKKAFYIDYVFYKNNITQAQFDSSMVWYTREAKTLTQIYESVNKRLKDQQSTLNHQIAIRDKKPMVTEKGDTVDIWSKDRLYRLTDYPASNKLIFEIPSDENFKFNDELLWKMNFIFSEGYSKNDQIFMAMSVLFENDSLVSLVKPINKPGVSSIRLKSDSISKIRNINGFVYYTGNKKGKSSLLINQISLTRYHESKSKNIAPKNKKTSNEKPALKLDQSNELKKVRLSDDSMIQKIEKQPMRINQKNFDHPRVKKQ